MISSVNDTNVWVSGIVWNKGAGYLIRRHWEAGNFQHFVSSEILYELVRVLRDVFNFPDDPLYDWYWLLLAGSVYIVPTTRVDAVKDDPDDNKFLACAVDGGAGFVVSEDKDLLRIGNYGLVQIVRKQMFLSILEDKAEL